jgi:hypothetical protein
MSSSTNYNGRQPNNTSYIKTFVDGGGSGSGGGGGGGGGSFFKYAFLFGEKVLTTILDIDVYLPGNLFIGGSFYNYYSTYFTGSDVKLKENIKKIDDGVGDLNPVQFNYINDKSKLTHFGLIAQEVKEIYPNLVNKEKDLLFVNYQEIIPLLIKEIKELKKRIEILESPPLM